jgi:hypothetical protein
MSFNQLK